MNPNKQYYTLLIVLGASLLLSLSFSPPFEVSIDDLELFRYAGTAILRGQVPYRDFFDHKPPMIYFINAAGVLLGPWGLWLISAAFAMLITYLLFRLCIRYRLAYPLLLPLVFNLMIRDNLISGGIHSTREYSTFFVMLFFCVLMGEYRYRHFLLGLLAALTFFTQQEQILLLLPFLLYTLFAEDRNTLIKSFVGLGTGFLTIALLLVLYFAIHHSLNYFWKDAYLFNFTVYIREKKSLGDHFRTIKHVLDAGNYEIPFMIALILGIATLFQQNKKRSLVIAAIIALILSMSAEFMGGRWAGTDKLQEYNTYFLPLSASVCILLFVVFAFTEDKVFMSKRAQLPYALLLCCSLFYTSLQHSANLRQWRDRPEAYVPELSYLQQQKLTDYKLYIFLNSEYGRYYNEMKILSPSPWLYQHFWLWYPRWDADQGILKSIARDLLQHRTTYVLMDPKIIDLMLNPVSRNWWMSFIKEYYQPVTVPDGKDIVLWQLKDTAS